MNFNTSAVLTYNLVILCIVDLEPRIFYFVSVNISVQKNFAIQNAFSLMTLIYKTLEFIILHFEYKISLGC